ncbi:HDIG domain-containing protein [Pontibacillus yanchengensis]|uniref:HDIG domain-containing protein n=2 Tax=Pontibacillus yanchengensis TaxID=462910 RepID=A0A6I4ZZW8_9BACI|nr:HDIG domain-containing metalloprotein [Pontibacillus yanchengensis]MYL33432.1 HDIG domain-containing protein [Pontibacillus yanchengensis]MYL53482.1 HDIG domain-containing protein [Pontibacillus yanchengensis]
MYLHWLKKLKKIKWVQNTWLQVGVTLLILATALFFMSFSNVQTKTYDVEQFEKAEETILSPITIEDKVKTDEKRSQAFQSVEDIHTVSTEVISKRVNYINDIFNAVSTIESKEKKSKNEQKTDQLTSMLSNEITNNLDSTVFKKLLASTSQERKLAEELIIKEVNEILKAGVKAEEVQAAKSKVQNQLNLSSFNADLREAIHSIASFAIVESSFLNLSKTNQAKTHAANEVDPVMIRQGQVLVFQGERITSDIYNRLKLVGLLDSKNNLYPYIGLILFIVLSMGVIAYEINHLHKDGRLNTGNLLAIGIISMLAFLFMEIGSFLQDTWAKLYFAVPLATCAFLLKILIQERIAIILSVLYTVFATIFFNQQIPGTLNIEAGLFLLFSQLSAIMLLNNQRDRMYILKAGLGVTVINVLLVIVFTCLSYEPLSISAILVFMLFAVQSAFLSSVLTLGLLPFFEAGLGILSDTKLLTLANPNHPLLRKILTETPGTYHHSIMVANLSEAACEAVGANGLLARVGSYYHDLGKTYKPHYFIENQMGIKNPHDMIEPEQSAEIIIEHPYLGAETLRKHNMPQEIVDIAEQHHGTTLLKYFYHKAREGNNSVSEHQFRYPGPKPQTKEAAIISICDSVEAAVRSLKQPTTQDIEEIVRSIVTERLLDGQLHSSPLTMKDLDRVQVAICETLQGIFHSRIQYPESKQTIKEAT